MKSHGSPTACTPITCPATTRSSIRKSGYFSLFTPILLGINQFFLAIWISLGVHLAIGGFAFYRLMTRLGSGPLPTLLLSTAFLFGSWPLAHFSAGHPTWQTWYLLPLCFDFLQRGMESFRRRQPYFRALVLMGLVHAVMIFEGGQHIWVMSALALGLFSLLSLAQNPGPRLAAGFMAVQALVMTAFASPKLIPMLMLFSSYTSAHDSGIEVGALFDSLTNLSLDDWERDFFVGYPVLAVLASLALLWPLRGLWRSRSETPEGLISEDRRALIALILLFLLFAVWTGKEWFDAVPILKTQGVRSRYLGLSIFFALLLSGPSITSLMRSVAANRARRIGLDLAMILLIGLNVFSLREKVARTHSKSWVSVEEFQPVEMPLGVPAIRAWDERGNLVRAEVRMMNSADFEVIWPGSPPGEAAMLDLPRLPYELYRRAFDNPGATVMSWSGNTAFTRLQSSGGRISFYYTLYYEKVGLLAFVFLVGLLPVCRRLTHPRAGTYSKR